MMILNIYSLLGRVLLRNSFNKMAAMFNHFRNIFFFTRGGLLEYNLILLKKIKLFFSCDVMILFKDIFFLNAINTFSSKVTMSKFVQ